MHTTSIIKKHIFTLIAFLSGIGSTMAQYSVSGEVVDSTGLGEPYATIRIYAAADTTKTVAIGTTTETGTFKQSLSATGNYRLSIASVGKKLIKRDFSVTQNNRDVNLGRMVAHVADNMLAEVEIVAQKPLVTAEIDRLSYDVANDQDAKANSTLEMLKKVPMVTVDGQDNIKVNGSSDFKIYKNGRPDNTLSGNPSQVLKAIPANMVEKIEVITEPGAKYDAEGVTGILNIVMKDNNRIDGIMGSAYVNYNQPNQVAGAYVTTSFNDKFTTSLNYTYVNLSPIEQYNDKSFTYKNTGNNEQENSTFKNPGNVQYASLEMSYEIDSLNLLTASFNGYALAIDQYGEKNNSMYDSNGDQIYSYQQIYPKGQEYNMFNVSGRVDYQHETHRKGETLNLSYMLSASGTGNTNNSTFEQLVNPQFDYTSYFYDSDQKFMEHTFQLDYTNTFNQKHKIDVGAKYIFRRNHSLSTTQQDEQPGVDMDFTHRTHVGAVYGEYSFTSGAWMARAGVRYEFSRMTATYNNSDNPGTKKNLNDLVPTLSLGYRIDDKNNLKLNFATRINRPGISYLDPTRAESPVEVDYGNPDLSSARNHSLQATYTFIHPKVTINASLNGLLSNDQITRYYYTDERNIRYGTYGNIGKWRQGYVSLYVQWMPSRKTNISINGSAGYFSYANDNLGINNDDWVFNIFANVSQELPWKLRLTLYGGRSGGGPFSIYAYSKPTYYYMMALQRSFLKDDRLTVRLYAINPFSSKYYDYKFVTAYGDYTGTEIGRYINRMFQVSISYNFGSLKASVKKTRTTITNDDVVGGGNEKAAKTDSKS